MGIFIRGMEMPTNCESCPCKTADAFGGLGCQATGYISLRKANQDRPDSCPLVPVPPHGRLIDADALPSKDVYDQNWREYGYSQYAIDATPTIIPAEED